jgi:hypothetical protein
MTPYTLQNLQSRGASGVDDFFDGFAADGRGKKRAAVTVARVDDGEKVVHVAVGGWAGQSLEKISIAVPSGTRYG